MSEQEQLRDRSRSARTARPTGIARHGRLPRSSAAKTVFGLIGGALAVVLVAGAAVGGIAYTQLTGEISAAAVEINPEGEEAPIPEIGAYEGGFNILVVGSDANYDRKSVLNDVNILIHVSADQTNAVAVSIPRDMVVPFPGCIDEETGKKGSAMSGRPINEALYYGGLPCVVDVVENFTGVDIQFAGMIGFDGVAQMATAVGGVDVCVASPIKDKYVGLDLSAGTHHLEGYEALAFVRSRHGVGDGSDLTRISSQQVFMSALLRQLKDADTLTNVGKLIGIAKAASANMTLSKELSQVPTMVAMAKALSHIPMDRIVFVQYPGTTGQGGIYSGKVAPVQGIATKLMDAIRADQPIGVEAGDGRGSVLDPNATTPPVDPAVPAVPADPSATPDPSATTTPEPVLPDKVVIPNLRGQTAADQTCTVGN